MRHTQLGSLQIPVIGLGCNNFGRALDQAGSTAVVDAAFDTGATFFDTAANYGNGQSEHFLGKALRGRRDEAIVATKFGVPRPDEERGGASAAYIRHSVERSLAALGTDVIDLLQLHKPDPDTPIAETLGAMWDLVDSGTVREIGCSNLDRDQMAEAMAAAAAAGRTGFVSNQVHYSLVHRAPETTGLDQLDVALLPFYPLGNGLLTGKTRRGGAPQGRLQMDRYERFLVDRNFDIAEATERLATEVGVQPAQVALAWLLARPSVPAVTPGATTRAQVMSNAAAASVALTDAQWAAFDETVPATVET